MDNSLIEITIGMRVDLEEIAILVEVIMIILRIQRMSIAIMISKGQVRCLCF